MFQSAQAAPLARAHPLPPPLGRPPIGQHWAAHQKRHACADAVLSVSVGHLARRRRHGNCVAAHRQAPDGSRGLWANQLERGYGAQGRGSIGRPDRHGVVVILAMREDRFRGDLRAAIPNVGPQHSHCGSRTPRGGPADKNPGLAHRSDGHARRILAREVPDRRWPQELTDAAEPDNPCATWYSTTGSLTPDLGRSGSDP